MLPLNVWRAYREGLLPAKISTVGRTGPTVVCPGVGGAARIATPAGPAIVRSETDSPPQALFSPLLDYRWAIEWRWPTLTPQAHPCVLSGDVRRVC